MINLNNNTIPKSKSNQKRRKRTTKKKTQTGKSVRVTVRNPPIAKNYLLRRTVPTKRSHGNNYTVKAEDYYDDLTFQEGLSNFTIQINPGLDTFPWLSQQAQGYDKYRIKSFTVTYVPKNAVTTTPGTIYGAYDYDCDDVAPPDVKTIMSYQSAKSGCLYEKLFFNYNPKCANEGMTWRRVRNHPTSHERFLYDPANFHLLVDSPLYRPDAGQLIFSYVVEFSCPGLPSSIIPSFPSNVSILAGSINNATVSGTTDCLWTIRNPAAFLQLDEKDSSRIILKTGVYEITYSNVVTTSITAITGGEYVVSTLVYCHDSTQNLIGSVSYIRAEHDLSTEAFAHALSYTGHFYMRSDGASTNYMVLTTEATSTGSLIPDVHFESATTNCTMTVRLVS